MQKYFTGKKLLLILAAAILLVVAGLTAKDAYEKHQLTQRLLKEEIYMFQDTYMFQSSVNGTVKTIYAYYMVCEPVDDKVQLVEKLERLMEEKQVIQGAKNYYQGKFGYDNLRTSVKFYKPSKEFSIGWQPLESYSMEDYQEISDNLILTINIPWDAKSEDERTYYFWRPDKPPGGMTFDVYKKQTQEDGSFILIPEN